LNYYFDESDLPKIKAGIKKCKTELGKYKKELDTFFNDNNGYNDIMIAKETDIPKNRIPELLEVYARLHLGEKIQKCVKENGECNFDAEL